jgi:hypothetical protein
MAAAFRKSANVLFKRCGLIFCALMINGFLTEFIAFSADANGMKREYIYLAYACILTVFPFFVARCLLKLKRGAGSFALHMLSEMAGWACVSVVLEYRVHYHDASKTISSAASTFGIICCVVPTYVALTRITRLVVKTSSRLNHHMEQFEMGVATFLLGFTFNNLFFAIMLDLFFKGMTHPSMRFIIFSLELTFAVKVGTRIEHLRQLNDNKVTAVFEEMCTGLLAVAVGYAWLFQYEDLYSTLLYYAFSKDPPYDDENWLEHESEHLSVGRAFMAFVWLAVVGFVALAVHASVSYREKIANKTCLSEKCRSCCRRGPEQEQVLAEGAAAEKEGARKRRARIRSKATKISVALGAGFATERTVLEVLYLFFVMLSYSSLPDVFIIFVFPKTIWDDVFRSLGC